MNIVLLNPFYTSSHKQWTDILIKYSKHKITPITLPGRHWKWRMHHAGKYFAYEIATLKSSFDMIICSDMMNVAEFRGILGALGKGNSWYNKTPIITYFHENQITYPWSDQDPDPELKRDNHYGWINYTSCLSSDAVIFNSQFHKSSFLSALPPFLKQFPNEPQEDFIKSIEDKSSVLPIGLELKHLLNLKKQKNAKPVILWNHRWEFDKNPALFFQTLIELKLSGLEFEVIVAGEKYKTYPKIFDEAAKELEDRIIHFGYLENRKQYETLLERSDILPITSNQDFFGISAIEGIAAGCIPFMPKRLAFPEHLSTEELQGYYYKTPEELSQMLVEYLSNEIQTSEISKLRQEVSKYDIENVAPLYDAFFNQWT